MEDAFALKIDRYIDNWSKQKILWMSLRTFKLEIIRLEILS